MLVIRFLFFECDARGSGIAKAMRSKLQMVCWPEAITGGTGGDQVNVPVAGVVFRQFASQVLEQGLMTYSEYALPHSWCSSIEPQ